MNKNTILIIVFSLTFFLIGMLTYAVIDDIVDTQYTFGMISYGVSEGCDYYKNESFTKCYIETLIKIDNKLKGVID